MEVRSYPFPEPLAGQRVLLLATNGQAGRPALGDGISAGSTDAKAVRERAQGVVDHQRTCPDLPCLRPEPIQFAATGWLGGI